MTEEVLFKAATQSPAAAGKPNVSRIVGRPKAQPNFKYGGIRLGFKNSDAAVPPPLTSWDDMARYHDDRVRAFAELPGGADLVEIGRIVTAIERYGEQSEWSRDESGKFTVRPIQAATLPVSLAGHNLVATAETGSGKTMCFATVALAAVSKTKKAPQVLIMAHNRPLLDQLTDEMDKLCSSLNNEITCAFADRQVRPTQAPLCSESKARLRRGSQHCFGAHSIASGLTSLLRQDRGVGLTAGSSCFVSKYHTFLFRHTLLCLKSMDTRFCV